MLFRRMFLMLAAAVLLVSCAWPSAAENADAALILAGFDDTSLRRWEDNRFFTQMQEWTGLSFSFRQFTKAEEWKQYKAGFSEGGEVPDILFKASLTQAECIALREKGVLIDLKPYLETCAPHLWAILQERPEVMDAITLPDGSIAALPYIHGLPAQNYIWINRQWLDNLRLEEPTTAEELTAVLEAFKTRDPNRNGQDDEIPLGFLGPFDLKFLAHAFGLICNDYNVFVENEQVRFMPLEENYRQFVSWCRELYAAGLLDPNGFSQTDSMRQVTDEKKTPVYGAIFATAPTNIFRVPWADQYTPLAPLTYEGKRIYRDFFGPVQRGTFAVTSACPSPEAALRWVDLLYTEQGAVLASAGKENVDYFVDGDGTWRLAESASSNSSLFYANSIMDGGTAMPGFAAEDFMLRFSGQTDAYRRNYQQSKACQEYAVMPFPYCSLTDAQEKEILALQALIGEYVDVMLGRWILGEEEISDEAFAAFEEKLKELGLPEFLAFWQDVLDQQQGRK